jgi:hypothetical protein
VAAGLGFSLFRGKSMVDLPRLTIVRQEQVNGQNGVIFRIHAPKYKGVELRKVTTQNSSTGMEREPVTDAIPGNFLEAGKSTMFSVIAPVDDVWRVRYEVALEDTGMKEALQRLKLCWRVKSFGPLRWQYHFFTSGIVESEPITNGVPEGL